MDVIDALMQAGFTRHESMLYMTLCKEGELTGYEASKLTGIPRSNAYLGLAGLSDKGGAYKINGEAARYIAVQPEELVQNLKRKFSEIMKVIQEEIPQLNAMGESFVTINGRQQMLDKMKNLMNQARKRIYISISREQLDEVLEELIQARDKGLKVVVITSEKLAMERVICYCKNKRFESVRLITDSENVLTGQLGGTNPTCLFSRNSNMVDLIKDSLTNEIKLININTK
ncbi:sugar-specific transcriptional regulator TrmB [Ruminiclostridium hungatei]|uniref:Sugar-specific transcriptional regulator TrmB n=1 Tax=Ruminiclostridium hungatei TaxID=48256 RepID=A0A1V4SHK4_RUMHU|nr:helix-turn-helix domain-containing protein [Ruminiclostridium hungatei]OPX42727.1 sugar-specific transcriptional regulator TrmB [Ruminiclostridium hungatei]